MTKGAHKDTHSWYRRRFGYTLWIVWRPGPETSHAASAVNRINRLPRQALQDLQALIKDALNGLG
jgi:hypothetical protein